MKVGTTEKIKFKRTKRALGLPLWQAVGLIESVWMSAYQNAPAGDIGKMSNEDIAAAIEWEGSPDELIAQLVKDGWLDEDEEFRLIVHDWSDHVAQFLKGAFAKHGKLFADQVAKQRAKQRAKQNEEQPAKDVPSTLPPIQFNSSQSNVTDSGVPESESAGADASAGNGKPDTAPKGLLRLIELWNGIPGIQRCRDATPARINSYRVRSKQEAWMQSVKPALDRVAKSDFCHGQNDRNWLADIDWFLRPNTVTKIMEGKYDNRTAAASHRVADIPTGGTPVFNAETGEIVLAKETT